MILRRLSIALIPALLILPAAATAQLSQSDGYKFLEAVRSANGDDVNKLLNKPGTTVINTKDYSSGETALHIVAKRGDVLYTRFLLQKGANPNLRDAKGSTPLLAAIRAGQDSVIEILIKGKANVNIGNNGGETPLILAVQLHNLGAVRDLLAAGADADQPDNLSGKSARDYAIAERRLPQLAALFADIPKRDRRALVGPR